MAENFKSFNSDALNGIPEVVRFIFFFELLSEKLGQVCFFVLIWPIYYYFSCFFIKLFLFFRNSGIDDNKMASEVSSSIKNNFDDLEIKFDTESIIKTSSPSMTFNEESKELMRIPSVDDEYDAHLDDATEEIDSVQNKIFDNLDLKRELAGIPGLSVGIPNLSCDDTDNNGYVSSAPSCSSTHDGAASKDGSEKSEEIKTSEVFEHRDMESFMKITGYVLSPPMTNPVDMTVYKSTIAIADYETGVHFVDRGGYSRKHFKVTDFK